MAEAVERELCLVQECVPHVPGEVRVHACQDGYEVGLESADGALRGVTAVDVRWHELVRGFPYLCDCPLVFATGFVVQDLQVNFVAAGVESLYDGVVGLNPVFVLAGLERGMKDGVGIAMVRNHYVLVAAAGPDGESATIVSVQPTDRLDAQVEFPCRDWWEGWVLFLA